MYAYINNKRITKYELAKRLEELPGNTKWGFCDTATLVYNIFKIEELANTYNNAIERRQLNLPKVEIRQ